MGDVIISRGLLQEWGLNLHVSLPRFCGLTYIKLIANPHINPSLPHNYKKFDLVFLEGYLPETRMFACACLIPRECHTTQ